MSMRLSGLGSYSDQLAAGRIAERLRQARERWGERGAADGRDFAETAGWPAVTAVARAYCKGGSKVTFSPLSDGKRPRPEPAGLGGAYDEALPDCLLALSGILSPWANPEHSTRSGRWYFRVQRWLTADQDDNVPPDGAAYWQGFLASVTAIYTTVASGSTERRR